MESGPAAFAGTAFTLFGAGLLMWTAARLWQGEPVAHGARTAWATAAAALVGLVAGGTGCWLLLQV
ncbi:hypothetical protein [Streptomyces sp. URMC 123]|uniref:hypothetical protein n=1 Tax=Streptomyces sp. URMC 123 TaxID=3423403 RepID=UPI003F198CD7